MTHRSHASRNDEHERRLALRFAAVVQTPLEHAFDDLTALAALVCGTAHAAVTLADDGTPHERTFEAQAMAQDDVMVVSDAALDPRFSKFPSVIGGPKIRFYAGVALRDYDGRVIGALSAFDSHPRVLDSTQERALHALARQAVTQLQLRDVVTELTDAIGRMRILSGLVPMCAWCRKVRDDKDFWTRVEDFLENNSEASVTHSICPDCEERLR